MKSKITAEVVAEALCLACPRAGYNYEKAGKQSISERVANLLMVQGKNSPYGPYGPYVQDGDPAGWGGEKVLVTIFMESIGCGITKPIDYYGDGFDVADRASALLDGAYIEFVNAAVACVWPE
jgi:hypothetical protein